MTDETIQIKSELAQIIRMALGGQSDDIRLYVARLVRKYRKIDPQFADQIDSFLRLNPVRTNGMLRRTSSESLEERQVIPIDEESKLSLLKKFNDGPTFPEPIYAKELKDELDQLIEERKKSSILTNLGLMPSRSAIFVGPPGVGKTLTARWISSQLGVPLFVLDLTAVMSSFLGKSGSNLRSALDFAKQTPCVLLLDEIDAIAKRRSDDTDIGELKRLVTVILQEVDEWPVTGLLLAATNHPELIDPALWRRFDMIIAFEKPSPTAVESAIERFLGGDYPQFKKWVNILSLIFQGESFSQIERVLQRSRRALALNTASANELIEEIIKPRINTLDRQSKIALVSELAKNTTLSQHGISELTGVSRDTIRKYTPEKKTLKGRNKK